MSQAPAHPRDPIGWCGAIALGFWLLTMFRLGIPSEPYFDEIHYLPAAREMLVGGEFVNREHPLLGKEIMALGIAIFGDTPFGWRIFSTVAGTLALFAAMRALWFATLSRFATIAYGVLLASGFILFVLSRIAMLDIYCIGFLALAYWQLAGAMREPETGRWRMAIAGIALGLAMAAKWNAVPLAMVPGIAFLLMRLMAGRRHLLTSRRGAPVPGMTLLEAAWWLGVVPLVVYAVTFTPAFLADTNPLGIGPDQKGLIAHHLDVLAMHNGLIKEHPYQSGWREWVLNIRAIWFLYEPIDGAQRGVLLIGNPLTMLLGLPALVWCAVEGAVMRRPVHLTVPLLYLASMAMWFTGEKPIQFYYHYAIPSLFLLAALALTLEDLRQAGWRRMVIGVLVASVAMFVWFYPILSAAPLSDPDSFAFWMWLDSWR